MSAAPPPITTPTSPTIIYSSTEERRKSLQRQHTSYLFNEKTHTFSVVLPETPLWEQSIQHHFPGAIREEAFVKMTANALNNVGFHNYNTLSCVSTCRDEMCSPLTNLIDEHWKSPFMNIKDDVGKAETLYTHSFNLSSLAGMLYLGITGMKAAISHAPIDKDGKQRYVFFAFPHIGVNDKGSLGEVERPGHEKASTACGALVHFLDELHEGFLHLEHDPFDVEYSLLKQKLLKRFKLLSDKKPGIKEVTMLCYDAITADLEKLIELTVPKTADYAVLTGVQVHSPGGASYIYEGVMYTVINGEKQPLVV